MRRLLPLILAFLGGCHSVPQHGSEALHGIRSVSLERTSCHGRCPVYVVTIHANGRVTYEGRHHVAALGMKEKVVRHESVERLFEMISQSEFAKLKETYLFQFKPVSNGYNAAIGGSSTIVTISTGKAEKRITDRGGAPPLLAAIEALIFHVAAIEDWVGGWPYYEVLPNQSVESRGS